jgi:hypothetical protein
MRVWAAAATVCALALLATAPTVLAGATVKTGTYSGKTSQKAKVGFELSSSRRDCPNLKKGRLCIYQLDAQSTDLTDHCKGGPADSVDELINLKTVAKNGVVREQFGEVDADSRLTFYAKVKANRQITGWFEDRFSTGGGPVCTSGKVSFTTKRSGAVK